MKTMEKLKKNSKPYVVSQLHNKGALPPWTPASAGEARKIPSGMSRVSFVQ